MTALELDHLTNSLHLSEQDMKSVAVLANLNLTIPSQPELLSRLETTILDNPDISISRLAAIIKRDSGVSSRIFHLCNTVGAGTLGKIDTVEDAIMCLGINQILNITRSVLIEQMIGGASSSARFAAFWERAQGIAQIAAAAAIQKNIGISFDEAYMAGLFHDCGAAILMKAMDGLYLDKLSSSETVDWTRIAEVDEELGLDHALVGYITAQYWHLPDYICHAIRHHHALPAEPGRARTLIALLQFAIHLHNRILLGVDAAQWEAESDTVLEILGMTDAELGQYV